jgi:hypothetical protein
MRKIIFAGILISALTAGAPLLAQTNANDVAALNDRIARLEKRVDEMSQLLAPLKAQQAADARRKALRVKFDKRMAQDHEKHSAEQIREAESLMRIADQKWGSAEASDALQKLIKEYPDFNRAGCAMLYLAQTSQGEERAKNLQACIEKYSDCMYGDGVQVGVYARFLLANDYRSKGDTKKADDLANEIKTQYPDAIDHSGNLLVDSLNKAESK